MRARVCVVGLSCAAGAVGAQPTVNVDFDMGTVVNATAPLTGIGTTADQMAGIVVTATFDDNSVEDATWLASGFESGRSDGTGWSLSATGDTFVGPWQLTNTTGVPIRRLKIAGSPAAIMFDTTFSGLFGTSGSGQGLTFTAVSGSNNLVIDAMYTQPVGIMGAAPVGDLFATLDLEFTNPSGFSSSDSLVFQADTDGLESGGELIEPASGPVALWDNGPDNAGVGFVSTVNAHTSSRVADDCWLKEGMFYQCDAVYVRMAIADPFEPMTELYVYSDCDGVPDLELMMIPQTSFEFIRAGTGSLAGTSVYEIRYDLNDLKPGEDLRWFSPVHIGEGMGYWLTANNGTVQGRQAHADASVFGLPTWTPAEDELCCGICTDMYLRIEGKCCWRVLDQSSYDLNGLASPMLAQNAPWNRSYDDFQLADPCKEIDDWGICRIEAFFATNCDLSTVYGEIFENACDTPADPTSALVRLEPTSYVDTGDVINSGTAILPVYRFDFVCPPDVLPSGRNYWFSIFSEQGFVAGKRSVWLFEQRALCDIRLNEAVYYNPPIGFAVPTPVSDPSLAGQPRGHAFSVWVCDPG